MITESTPGHEQTGEKLEPALKNDEPARAQEDERCMHNRARKAFSGKL